MCCRPMGIFTSGLFPHSWLSTGFVTRLIRRVPLVEQELPTLPEHLNSPPVFSGVHVARSLVLCVCFVDHYLSFCAFSFGHCVVCSTSRCGFWLSLWYLQTLLTIQFFIIIRYIIEIQLQNNENNKIQKGSIYFCTEKGHRWTFKIIR